MQSAPPSVCSSACVACSPSASATTSSPGATSRTSSAPTRSSAHVSEAKTQSSWMPPDHERPEAVRVAEADEPSLRQRDDRVGALEPAHRVRHRLLERRGVVRDQRRDQLAVGGRPERNAVLAQLLPQLSDVDQVAVVAEGDRAGAAVLDERLRVRPLRRAGRRVAVVADRDLAVQAAELLLVEDLGDEAEVAQPGQPPVLGDRDPRRLLAAVLEREESEVRRAARRRGRVRRRRRRRTSVILAICLLDAWVASPKRCKDAASVDSRSYRRDRGRRSAPRARGPGAGRVGRESHLAHLADLDEAARAEALQARRGGRRGSRRRAASRSRPGARRRPRGRRSRPPPRRERLRSPPLPTSWQRLRCVAAFQRKRISAASAASEPSGEVASSTVSPLCQRPGTRRTSGTSPTQPTTGVGGIEAPSASL